MRSFNIAAAAAFAASRALAQSTSVGVEIPKQTATINTPTVQGCFNSSGDLVFNSTPQFNTIGSCSAICIALKKDVSATTGGNQCWCGDDYPPAGDLVDDSKCNVGCSGFDPQACGGINFWTVYNNGLNLSVTNIQPSSSSVAPSQSTATSAGGAIATVTQISQPQTTGSSSSSSGGGSNTAGIAAGVVVGVVAIAAIVGGVFFMMRRRRNMEIEEEHKRNAAVNGFLGGQKPPSSSGGFSVSDQRLDPVMAQRRMSSGSIADNQDYSRRILRVTNA